MVQLIRTYLRSYYNDNNNDTSQLVADFSLCLFGGKVGSLLVYGYSSVRFGSAE